MHCTDITIFIKQIKVPVRAFLPFAAFQEGILKKNPNGPKAAQRTRKIL